MEPPASKPRRWLARRSGNQEGAATDGAAGEPMCQPAPVLSPPEAPAGGRRPASAAYPPAPAGGAGAGRGVASAAGFTSGAFNEGARLAYMRRYALDLDRLHARADLPTEARWFDSHCHLESILVRTWRGGGKPQVTEHEPLVNLRELVEQWPAGLDGCICNCAFRRPSKPGNPSEWSWIEANMDHFASEGPVADKLWFTIGIHPHDAENWKGDSEAILRRLASHPKCVGIGECGLDFFKHDQGEAELQLRAFRAQAQIAVELGKALVIHGRLTTVANEQLCMSVLAELVPPQHPIHIHCYSDSLEHALALCSRWPKLRIGFTGAITFKDRAPKGKSKGKASGKEKKDQKKGEEHCRELVQGLPLERLLIETDGPYMCPEPFRGHTAHPGHVHRVAEKIAEWQGRGLGEVMAATRESTRVVYGV